MGMKLNVYMYICMYVCMYVSMDTVFIGVVN
jgi:hypothetical protein